MANLKDVIYLSNSDYYTLATTGTVTIGSETLTYDENNLYITPDSVATATEDGLMSASDKVKLDQLAVLPTITIAATQIDQQTGVITPTVDQKTIFETLNNAIVKVDLSAIYTALQLDSPYAWIRRNATKMLGDTTNGAEIYEFVCCTNDSDITAAAFPKPTTKLGNLSIFYINQAIGAYSSYSKKIIIANGKVNLNTISHATNISNDTGSGSLNQVKIQNSFTCLQDNQTYNTEASGIHSSIFGGISRASGDSSFAQGKNNVASGYSSHAEGSNNRATGSQSHAEGYQTLASGDGAHAEGGVTQANGNYSHAEGIGTIANGEAQLALGKYNIADTSSALVVGNGTSNSNRSNALTLDRNGVLKVNSLTDGTTTKTMTQVLSFENLESITYSNLVTLKTNSRLTAGKYYRITDYVTTTAKANTQSAGHVFDIIVQALSSNELCEDVRICHHSGDSYFANCDLEAWKAKYCIDNDTSRFGWADTTNGKGVIYYLKDEWDNECQYDFKNIMYLGSSLYNFAALTELTQTDYYYTFHLVGTGDYSLASNGQSSDPTNCRNNSMFANAADAGTDALYELPFISIIETSYTDIVNNKFYGGDVKYITIFGRFQNSELYSPIENLYINANIQECIFRSWIQNTKLTGQNGSSFAGCTFTRTDGLTMTIAGSMFECKFIQMYDSTITTTSSNGNSSNITANYVQNCNISATYIDTAVLYTLYATTLAISGAIRFFHTEYLISSSITSSSNLLCSNLLGPCQNITINSGAINCLDLKYCSNVGITASGSVAELSMIISSSWTINSSSGISNLHIDRCSGQSNTNRAVLPDVHGVISSTCNKYVERCIDGSSLTSPTVNVVYYANYSDSGVIKRAFEQVYDSSNYTWSGSSIWD